MYHEFLEPSKPGLIMQPELTTSTSCTFNWTAPEEPRGIIEQYEIFIEFSHFSYYVPEDCQSFQYEFRSNATANEKSFTFKDALPKTSYTIYIRARNGKMISDYDGSASLSNCETLQGNGELSKVTPSAISYTRYFF